MKKYKFLLKPAFFIFNLLFATWLVLKIEKLHPSDFGKYKSMFESSDVKPQPETRYDKYYLQKLAEDYKTGILDSANFDLQLERFIANAHKQQSVKTAAAN